MSKPAQTCTAHDRVRPLPATDGRPGGTPSAVVSLIPGTRPIHVPTSISACPERPGEALSRVRRVPGSLRAYDHARSRETRHLCQRYGLSRPLDGTGTSALTPGPVAVANLQDGRYSVVL